VLARLADLAAEVADLVAQAGGVLEAQVLGAAAISSSSSTIVCSSSLRVIASPDFFLVCVRLRPFLGTFDSLCRNSAMSETPLTIDAGVIPCSLL
jgi:hypothetical protein